MLSSFGTGGDGRWAHQAMSENPYETRATTPDDVRSFDQWRLWTAASLLLSVVALFVALPLMLTLLALLASNGIAYITLLILRHTKAANLAFLTGVLLVASLLFTDWGFSTPNPRIRVSWISLILACLSQLALISMPLWRLPNSPTGRGG